MKMRSSPAWLHAAACLAVAMPVCLAYNEPPSATFLNQALAFAGWPLLLLSLQGNLGSLATAARAMAPLLGALFLLVLSVLAAVACTGLPWALGLSSIGTLLVAMLVGLGGAAASVSGHGERAFRALCIGCVIAGVLSALVALIQVYAPTWADGTVIAMPSLPGRASGNVRQPNHLSTLLLSALVAVFWLGEAQVLARRLSVALAAMFILGIVLSASRTGMVGTLLLGAWGLVDRRLSRPLRRLLLLAPLMYFAFWGANSWWAHAHHQVFAGEARLTAEGDISSSRFGIWSNTLSLIVQHPLFGVGFGEFNFAWTLTPFPHRPVAFFDHTHNLPLQLLVELGLPLGLLVLGLLGLALYRAFVAGARCDRSGDRIMLRTAFVLVLLMVVHSMLEYPLWYAYFLLPTAFTMGLCLGARPMAVEHALEAPAAAGHRWPWLVMSVLALVGAVLSVIDYRRVVIIFSPPSNASGLGQRIADGEHSVLFAHHAYYAAATTADHPSQAMPAFKVATHYLLDTRLMVAWAQALNEAGDVERARHIAQRLREFHNDDAQSFFEPCDDTTTTAAEKPFQCTPPSKSFDYRDFK